MNIAAALLAAVLAVPAAGAAVPLADFEERHGRLRQQLPVAAADAAPDAVRVAVGAAEAEQDIVAGGRTWQKIGDGPCDAREGRGFLDITAANDAAAACVEYCAGEGANSFSFVATPAYTYCWCFAGVAESTRAYSGSAECWVATTTALAQCEDELAAAGGSCPVYQANCGTDDEWERTSPGLVCNGNGGDHGWSGTYTSLGTLTWRDCALRCAQQASAGCCESRAFGTSGSGGCLWKSETSIGYLATHAGTTKAAICHLELQGMNEADDEALDEVIVEKPEVAQ